MTFLAIALGVILGWAFLCHVGAYLFWRLLYWAYVGPWNGPERESEIVNT